jgi:murein DD-endopeptidase MepM/ murein hydrolase activator NlpD
MKYLILIMFIFNFFNYLGLAQSNDIQNELKKNTQIIKQKKAEEQSILKELGKLLKNIYLTQRRLNNAYQKYNSYHEQIKNTQAKLAQAQMELSLTKKYLNQKILTLYKQQNRPLMHLLFSSDSFSTLLTNMYFYDRIIETDYQDMVQAKKEIDHYNDNKKRLEFSKSKANQLKKTILQEGYALKNTKRRYQQNLTSLRDELRQFEERNQVLRDESKQLSQYIQTKSGVNNSTDVYLGTGTYIRPVGGYISSRFGLRRHPIFNRRRMHTGMDFAAPRGYRIKATDSGEVIFSGFKRGYGNVTIINHGVKKRKKISSLYAHQWKILVQKGQFVTKGQLIGYVGSTGYSTGPHLHFEIRENGTPVNPSQYLRL